MLSSVQLFCDPIDSSLPVSSVHGISQARILYRESWHAAVHGTAESDMTEQQKSFPSSGDLPDPGVKLTFPALTGRFFTTEPPGKCFRNRQDELVSSCFCCCLVTKSCLTLLRPHGLQPNRFLCPWDLPGKNTEVSCCFLLQGIFLTQGSNFSFLHYSFRYISLDT